ncbi:MAG: hypothetical protein RLY70_4726 [Planctomycetota bacterium]|jgi:hypothetical protein
MNGRYGWTLALLALLVAGCGGGPNAGPSGTVKGKVTRGGQPVAGTIYFNSGAEGKSAMGALQPDGSYQLAGEFGTSIPVGRYQVSLSASAGDSSAATADPAAMMPKAGAKGGIPPQYLSGDTSGWSAEVKAGENSFDFEVK